MIGAALLVPFMAVSSFSLGMSRDGREASDLTERFTTNSGAWLARKGASEISKLRKGVFIVAESRLKDPNFEKTVVLLTHYGKTGTVGVIINRPTATPLSKAFPHVKELSGRSDNIFFGGPVLSRAVVMLLRSDVKLEESYHVFGDVYFTGSLKALTQLLNAKSHGHIIRAYAGYASWAPGQLEFEIKRGDWRVVDADEPTIFEQSPETIWRGIMNPPAEPGQHWINLPGTGSEETRQAWENSGTLQR